jgi:RimJ/RimL family protein N-acetyltransferase
MVIHTERLILSPHGLDDFEACAAMWADPAVTRHIGVPSPASEVWGRVLRYAGHWALMGWGFFAVRERATGAFVGEVGLMDFKRDVEPRLPYPECGWVLVASAHGKGYATEACRALLAWADPQFPRTTCIIAADNAGSIRVARKLGFEEVRTTKLGDTSIVVFERAAGTTA